MFLLSTSDWRARLARTASSSRSDSFFSSTSPHSIRHPASLLFPRPAPPLSGPREAALNLRVSPDLLPSLFTCCISLRITFYCCFFFFLGGSGLGVEGGAGGGSFMPCSIMWVRSTGWVRRVNIRSSEGHCGPLVVGRRKHSPLEPSAFCGLFFFSDTSVFQIY